jgi:hypothetical protein
MGRGRLNGGQPAQPAFFLGLFLLTDHIGIHDRRLPSREIRIIHTGTILICICLFQARFSEKLVPAKAGMASISSDLALELRRQPVVPASFHHKNSR